MANLHYRARLARLGSNTFVQAAVRVAVAVPPAAAATSDRLLGTRDSAGGIAVVTGGAPLATAALAALSTSHAVARL